MSSTSRPCGGKTATWRKKDVVHLLRRPCRTVAVEATTFGRTVFPSSIQRAELVDGGFVQADHGAQWAADKMEFVLDDQIGRPDRTRCGFTVATGASPALLMLPAAIGPARATRAGRIPSSPARTASGLPRARPSSRICRRSRSSSTEAADRFPHRRRAPECRDVARLVDLRSEKSQRPSLSPQKIRVRPMSCRARPRCPGPGRSRSRTRGSS